MKTFRCPQCEQPAALDAALCLACGASLVGPAQRIQAGSFLAQRYRILRPLARGGMGAVYLATDTHHDGLEVAVKEMRVGGIGDTTALTQAIAEFHREARMLAQLSHPNLPRFFDQFADQGAEYLVMEFVPGHTLQAVLRTATAPVTEAQVRAWGIQLADVLHYLHTRTPPLIYRDLKPANIMLRPDGQLVLLDFGIARLYKHDQGDTAVFGTVGYAPPEQYEGRTDARSDLFSLGVLLHQLATGYNPLQRPYQPLPPVRTIVPTLSKEFETIIERATQIEPGHRFLHAQTFGAALAGTIKVSKVRRDRRASAQPPANGRRRQYGRLASLILGVSLVIAFTLLNALGVISATFPPTPRPSVLMGATPEQTPTGGLTTAVVPNAPTAQPVAPLPQGMVLVPDGAWTMGNPQASDAAERDRAGPQKTPAFLIDQDETTNDEYAQCVAAERCRPPHAFRSTTRDDYYETRIYATYPVVNVDWQQARSYCSWRGRRLPTEAEWEKAARGTESLLYPWGNDWPDEQELSVNRDKRVNSWGGSDATSIAGDTRRIGVRTAGASSYNVRDMVGNVGEWTSTLDLPGPYTADAEHEDSQLPGPRVVRGLPIGNDPDLGRVTTRFTADPNAAQPSIGFRCATSATPDTQRGVDGRTVPPDMRLVGGGIAQVGTDEDRALAWTKTFGWPFAAVELPVTPFTISPIYLDQHEVTNADYQRFVIATGHRPPQNSFDPLTLNRWQGTSFAAELARHPVVNVSWYDARAYCSWLGKRLPTEAEWEWAAEGAASRLWPWGNQITGDELNTKETPSIAETTPVSSFAGGVTPEGIADLGGNVYEWTSTLSLPYPYNQLDGREDGAAEGARVVRGGSWLDDQQSAHASARAQLQPDLANVNVGFRCAQTVRS